MILALVWTVNALSSADLEVGGIVGHQIRRSRYWNLMRLENRLCAGASINGALDLVGGYGLYRVILILIESGALLECSCEERKQVAI